MVHHSLCVHMLSAVSESTNLRIAKLPSLLGPVKVSWLEGWPHFRGGFALSVHWDNSKWPQYTGVASFQGSRLEGVHCMYTHGANNGLHFITGSAQNANKHLVSSLGGLTAITNISWKMIFFPFLPSSSLKFHVTGNIAVVSSVVTDLSPAEPARDTEVCN